MDRSTYLHVFRLAMMFLAGGMADPGSMMAQRPIEVTNYPDPKGGYVFIGTNKAFCPYVLHVTFNTFQNAKADRALPFEGQVKPGPNNLFKLSRENANGEIKFSFSVSYRKGCLITKPIRDYPYLLPISPGKETQAYVSETKKGDEWSQYAIRLRMKATDTIFASRGGIVTAINTGSSQNDAGVAGTDNWNAIEIFQGDSTFAQYGIVKKDGALVHTGQIVEAGTPIGLVGGDQYGRGSEARLSVFYYEGNTLTFIPLQFWTKKNGKGLLKHGTEYTSEFPPAILVQEMKKPPLKNKASKRK